MGKGMLKQVAMAPQHVVDEMRASLASKRGTMPCCQCGNAVTPQRLADRFVAYCHDCGKTEEWPASRVPFQRLPPTIKLCSCARTCRFCRGAR
jgi:hypothetical protein